MPVFADQATLNNAGTRTGVAAGSLEAAVVAIPGMVGLWSAESPFVIEGTDKEFVNLTGGTSMFEQAAYSGATFVTTGLPAGGQCSRALRFNANASLKATGVVTTGSTGRLTKFAAIKFSKDNIINPSTFVMGGPSGSTSNHVMTMGVALVNSSIGSSPSQVSRNHRVAIEGWGYFMNSWDPTTQTNTVGWGRMTPLVTTGAGSQVNSQADLYFGGHNANASMRADVLCWGLLSANSAAGDIFSGSMSNHLETLRAYLDAKTGVLNI